jgi:membrane dipeptidase
VRSLCINHLFTLIVPDAFSRRVLTQTRMPYLIIDAHEDLAWNALTFGRDYTRSVLETRRLEAGGSSPQYNGDTLLGWPEYQQGHIALVFGTLFVSPARRALGDWDTQAYATFDQARKRALAQLAVYQRLADEQPDKFRLVRSCADLENHLDLWRRPVADEAGRPVGLVLLLENAECIREPAELAEWWEFGLRIIGPAWAGTRFCGGTREPGPLTKDGQALLEAMADLGFSLDLSHMDRQAALQALDSYPGVILASHANPLALLVDSGSNRHLTDEVIDGIFEREGVIGVVPFNLFLKAGWVPADGRQAVPIQLLADHIDYLCQRAGDARHVGLGSDFDGGFGLQHVPAGIESIADLQKLAPVLEMRGYTPDDIAALFGANWIELLQRALPL